MADNTNSPSPSDSVNRRSFLKRSSAVIAASALAGIDVPHVFAAASNTINVALIGCGGRGSGAVINALDAGRASVSSSSTSKAATKPIGDVKLIAMADVFDERIKSVHANLTESHAGEIDVPPERRFVGFDAYRKAIDCLKPGDIAIMTTPPAFRWVHFRHAIDRGVNVFMEKPITVDGPTTKKMLALGDLALDKNLKVGVGLMCRHCVARAELFDRIKMGQLGDIITLRAYRVHGPVADCFVPKYPGPSSKMSETLYQIKNFHGFLWASGGLYSDFYIHNIDECCWMKDAWPVKAQAMGGRHYRGEMVDQNFDVYDVEYTFADGAKLFLQGRAMDGCDGQFASYAHGSKGAAQISLNGHTPARCRIWRSQDISASPSWAFAGREPNPYQTEWDHLLDAIRKDKPYNEVKRGAEASLVTSMGRMAAHTGQVVTRDDMFNCEHEFAPTLDKLTDASTAPLMADANGKYPIPEPGIKTTREF